MPVIYGAPLPPGLDASTKGELQIRIDKLILDDEAINHNPLVQQSLQSSSTRLTTSNSSTNNNNNGGAGEGIVEGPNRFVVPVHHCAVSPQFWGEQRPSAQCQPATPQQGRRGAITITYPVKLREESFAKYLHNMTRSPQKGLRLEVFVPSSYSGRKPVAVGQCVLGLDPLCAGEVIDGWFTVYHDRRRGGKGSSGAVFETTRRPDEGSSSSNGVTAKDHATETNEIDGMGPQQQAEVEAAKQDCAGPSREEEGVAGVLPTLFAIGRMKLRIQLTYFTRSAAAARRTSKVGHSSHPQHRDATPAVSPRKHAAHTSASKNGIATPAATSPRVDDKNDDNAKNTHRDGPDRNGLSAPAETVAAATVDTAVVKGTSEATLPTTTTTNSAEANKSTAVAEEAALRDGVQPNRATALDELMRRSLQLRDRIADAVAVAGGVPVLATTSLSPPGGESHRLPLHARRYHDETPSPAVAVPASHSPRPHALVMSDMDTEDETVYTSECSDAEARSLALHRLGSPHTRRTPGGAGARSDSSSSSSSSAAAQKRRRRLHSSPSSTRHQKPSPAANTVENERNEEDNDEEEEEEVEEFAAAVAAQDASLPRRRTRSHDAGSSTPPGGLRAHPIPPPLSSTPSVTMVELIFSEIAFATNAMTAALTAMRLNVRLSADITTEAPNAGPFSSYVHPVPLRQSAICLSFAVRTFSEQTSRLVIECLKVTSSSSSSLSQATTSAADTREATEELLGLCIVGLYAQSRAIVLRDPVSNLNNVLGRLTVQLMTNEATTTTSKATAVAATPRATSVAATSTPHSVPSHRMSPSGMRGKENDDRIGPLRSPKEQQQPEKRTPSRHTVVEQREAGLGPRSSSSPYGTPHALLNASTGQATSSRSTQSHGEPGRFRLRVAIRSAKEVPLVALRETTSSSHRNAHIAALLDRRSFVAPNTFFVVEDVYSGVDGHVASTGPVSAWYVEQVHGGHYDRTHIVPCSQRPEYNYRCTLSLPYESVYLRQRPSQGGTSDAGGSAAKACLRELRLTLWHHAQADKVEETAARHTTSPLDDEEAQETLFWSQAAYMGESRIDLRPLRYLSHLDGYYRVVATASAAAAGGGSSGPAAGDVDKTDDACGAPLCAVPGQTVGYVHVCVSLCHGEERSGDTVDC